ncbi:hypothetical protein HRbin41_01465 [bacterium HR41]|nr:hypothetical protein HRbin41_01465 [bacterium HR41]
MVGRVVPAVCVLAARLRAAGARYGRLAAPVHGKLAQLDLLLHCASDRLLGVREKELQGRGGG